MDISCLFNVSTRIMEQFPISSLCNHENMQIHFLSVIWLVISIWVTDHILPELCIDTDREYVFSGHALHQDTGFLWKH